MRTAEVSRETKETKINVSLDLDGNGEGSIDTGIGFLDHMLELFAFHVKEILIDCDEDTLLIKVEQDGAACHTGKYSCFYRTLEGEEIL